MSLYTYVGSPTHIVDGDTLDAVIDLGFHIAVTDRFRLDGLNAPELSSDAGKASRDYVIHWFTDNPGPYVFHTTADKKEKWGRWLASVASSNGRSLNQDLVDSGHALPWDGHGPRPV